MWAHKEGLTARIGPGGRPARASGVLCWCIVDVDGARAQAERGAQAKAAEALRPELSSRALVEHGRQLRALRAGRRRRGGARGLSLSQN